MSLLALLVLSASVQASLPNLVVSARVMRGYSFQGRDVMQKKIDSLVVSIPLLSDDVKRAIKKSMLGSFDVYESLRKVRLLLAHLVSLKIQGKSPSLEIKKKMRETLSKLPSVILPSIKDLIDKHRVLPNWNSQRESEVAALVFELPLWIAEISRSFEAFAKSMTTSAANTATRSLVDKSLSDLFNLFSDQVQELVEQTQSYMSLDDLYKLSAYLYVAGEEPLRYSFLLSHCHHKLLMASLLAMEKPSWRLKGDRLRRALMAENSASVMKTVNAHQCFAFGDVSCIDLQSLPCEPDLEALEKIADVQERNTIAAHAVIQPMEDVLKLADKILASRGTPADFAKLKAIACLGLKDEHEKTLMELQRLNVEYIRNAMSRCT